jgi:hypothetical protein
MTEVFVLVSLVLGSAVAGTPSPAAVRPRVDYVAKLNALIKQGQDESLNAEPYYRRALESCVELSGTLDKIERWWPTQSSPEQQAVAREWVKANAEALGQLELGARKPGYWFQYRGERIADFDQLRHIRQARILFTALVVRMRLRAADGDVKGAIDDLLLCYRFGSDMKSRPLMTDQLLGIAIQAQPLQVGFQILGRTKVDRDLRDTLQTRLVEVSKDQDFVIDLRGDELAALDTIQTAYARLPANYKDIDVNNISPAQRKCLDDVVAEISRGSKLNLTAEELWASVTGDPPDQLAQRARMCYTYCDTVISMTPWQWRRGDIDFFADVRDIIGRNLLLYMLVPAVQQQVQLCSRGRATHDALMTTLAILRYRDEKGALPDDLETLVSAGYLSRLPMDPYSDKPLIYKRTDGDFTLYSRALNFRDNGGKPSNWGQDVVDGDQVFWPIQH